jgi:CheY-like chemotaxis protein
MTQKSILLVDDEPLVLRVMRVAFEKAGYDVETCRNGHEALMQIRQRQPDVLVTDIEMPRMTGRELCEQLELEFPQRSFPIFVSTSLTSLDHRDWSGKITDLHFMEKPISVRTLLSKLSEYFDTSTAAGF